MYLTRYGYFNITDIIWIINIDSLIDKTYIFSAYQRNGGGINRLHALKNALYLFLLSPLRPQSTEKPCKNESERRKITWQCKYKDHHVS